MRNCFSFAVNAWMMRSASAVLIPAVASVWAETLNVMVANRNRTKLAMLIGRNAGNCFFIFTWILGLQARNLLNLRVFRCRDERRRLSAGLLSPGGRNEIAIFLLQS